MKKVIKASSYQGRKQLKVVYSSIRNTVDEIEKLDDEAFEKFEACTGTLFQDLLDALQDLYKEI